MRHDSTGCCDLLIDDLMELRIKGALPRMEALGEVIRDNGAPHMAAICAICFSSIVKRFTDRRQKPPPS